MAFGIALSVRSRVRECTPALFNQVVDGEQTGRVCAEIEDALEKVKRGEMSREDFETFKGEQKKRLAIFTPHATFPKGRRLSEDAVPSGLSMYDIDHIPDPRGYFKSMIANRVGDLGIVLAHVTPSTEGLRLFFVMPEGMTLEEAQRWMSQQLDDSDYDGCVKDLARCSFVVPREYFLYLDEEGLWKEPQQNLKTLPRPLPVREGSDYQGTEVSTQEASPRTLFIFDACMKEAELTPEVLIVRGHRHEALKSILSVGATQLLKKEELLGVLKVRMPQNWQDQNIQQLVNDFYSKYHDESQKMTTFQRRVLARSLKTSEMNRVQSNNSSPIGETGWGIPEMPRKLPPLIELLTSKTPDIYKAAVSHAVFPSLGAHLYKTRFRYINNVEHEATLMNVLMAETGAGKDCISGPINHIMADIRRRDEENLAREKAWKDEVNRKGANKDKRQRPEGLVIQEIDADMTGPAFVMRMAEADGHFLYTKMNEIDQFDALKGNGRGGHQFQIMCLAFDPENRYGQTRVGVQSVTEKICIRFNWNAATTVRKGQRYFERVLTDGPISRINFCTIPEREIGAEMPIYGTYDAAFDEELRPYIERLCSARGTIECPQAYKLAVKLKDECADFARLSQSRTYENFSFRALVIAYLKACVLYVAHDYKWDKTMEDFVRWSLQYDLWCKMYFFAEAIEQANNGCQSSGRRGPRNLLELLPDEFSLEDAIRIRREQGIPSEGVSDMIRTWRNRGYIEERTNEQLNSFDKRFVKLKFKY